ncbi:hypothetical protein AX17_003072 [Amanita inopinata Kibby_2008]|nr:hypothetical protein AX17_003072 [Amanita inopinata Kibby_2008]
MLCRRICVAFLSLALTSFTAQAAPFYHYSQDVQCQGVTTIHHTVTVTVSAPAQASTSSSSNNGGSSAVNVPGSGSQTGIIQNGGSGSTSGGNNGGAKNNTGGQNTSSSGRVTSSGKNSHGTSTTITPNGVSTNTLSASVAVTSFAAIVHATSIAATGATGTGGQGIFSSVASRTTSANAASSTSGSGTGSVGTGNSTAGGDPQTSLILDPRVIATGFANDGQDTPTPGQVKSLTTTNNFINFCLNVNAPLTNGKQITTGSCNPAPIGVIPSVQNMPSSKFAFPQNFGAIKTNTPFTIKMAIKNMEVGFFVNAKENYFAAPQTLNAQGQIQGHSHVVIEQLSSLDQTTPTDPQKFAFFKGLNDKAQNGFLTADVTNGLPAGVYKLSSINAAANHQPVIVPIAQHGSLDDVVYFTVTADGNPAGGSIGGSSSVASSVSATTTSAASASVSVTATATSATSAPASVSGTASASFASISATNAVSTLATASASASRRIIASATASPPISASGATLTNVPSTTVVGKNTIGGKGRTRSTTESGLVSSNVAAPSAVKIVSDTTATTARTPSTTTSARVSASRSGTRISSVTLSNSAASPTSSQSSKSRSTIKTVDQESQYRY